MSDKITIYLDIKNVWFMIVKIGNMSTGMSTGGTLLR